VSRLRTREDGSFTSPCGRGRYDYPSFTTHTGDVLTHRTAGSTRALTTPLVPLTIDAITMGRLSQIADRIPMFFPHI
jgi:hypothetical protein